MKTKLFESFFLRETQSWFIFPPLWYFDRKKRIYKLQEDINKNGRQSIPTATVRLI